MSFISGLSSDRSYKSSVLLGIAGIASVGAIAMLVRRSYVYREKSRLREALRQEFAFHPFHDINATSAELSEIASNTLPQKYVRADISRRKPFQDPILPLPLTNTINRLATEIMDQTGSSSIQMQLNTGGDSLLVGWHIDNCNDKAPVISNVRFVCTLRGPTTRFAQLSFKDRVVFKELTDKHYQTTNQYNREKVDAQIAKEVGIGPANTFFPKIGQVIAFCSEDPNGAVHAGPLSLDSNRVRVIFDLPD